jgi:NAD(P)-dependent dehydrogenase (short-subunit alcohol dehydrogenase family)
VSSELESKIAIVTATGIGTAIAFAFGAARARVVGNHLDTPDPAEAVVAQISRMAARGSRLRLTLALVCSSKRS